MDDVLSGLRGMIPFGAEPDSKEQAKPQKGESGWSWSLNLDKLTCTVPEKCSVVCEPCADKTKMKSLAAVNAKSVYTTLRTPSNAPLSQTLKMTPVGGQHFTQNGGAESPDLWEERTNQNSCMVSKQCESLLESYRSGKYRSAFERDEAHSEQVSPPPNSDLREPVLGYRYEAFESSTATSPSPPINSGLIFLTIKIMIMLISCAS